ncbi:MAG: HAD hydrolase-like protein, partial [Acidimicrobiia bacterium]|nr:HAD hydrolase-like protein [Acidimicrobiia bacterium]
ATLNQGPPVELPPPGEDGHGWVVVDGMGVLFQETDPVENLLIPFARERGSPRTDVEILARARALRLGRMTTGELWASLGVPGDPEELDAAYLAHHQLSPGVIRYLRSLREQGVRLACITDDAANWNARLRVSHSLETLIELWVVSGSVGAVKPDRSLYEVLRRFAQEPPSRILVIDDDRKMLDAARVMGYATAWFTSTGTRAEAGDHQVIRSFEGAADDLVDDRR